jgi:hypothetical protein
MEIKAGFPISFSYQLFVGKVGKRKKLPAFFKKCLIFLSAFRKSWQERSCSFFRFSPQLFLSACPISFSGFSISFSWCSIVLGEKLIGKAGWKS